MTDSKGVRRAIDGQSDRLIRGDEFAPDTGKAV